MFNHGLCLVQWSPMILCSDSKRQQHDDRIRDRNQKNVQARSKTAYPNLLLSSTNSSGLVVVHMRCVSKRVDNKLDRSSEYQAYYREGDRVAEGGVHWTRKNKHNICWRDVRLQRNEGSMIAII